MYLFTDFNYYYIDKFKHRNNDIVFFVLKANLFTPLNCLTFFYIKL